MVSPGARTDDIRFNLTGAQAIRIDEEGALAAQTEAGDLRLLKPVAWQTVNGERRDVDCQYRINPSRQIEFQVGDYDRSQTLVIDPVIVYSTLLGGALNEFAYGIAVDNDGAAYITGDTDSTDFPGSSPIQQTKGAVSDVFVLKIDPAGSNAVYATWIGGNGTDRSNKIAVDSNGAAYICGFTLSSNFPTKDSYQATRNGSTNAFLTKINAAGSALVYSTYLGEAGSTIAYGLAVGNDGAVYLTGNTDSPNFPLMNALQATRKGSSFFTSSDGGAKWTATPVSPNVAGAADVEVDPKTPSTIYLATETGIFKTTNGGGAWAQIGADLLNRSVSQISVDPITTTNVYAVAGGGVYKSADGGTTWNRLGSVSPVLSLTIDPTTPTTLYAADAFRGLKSVDGGANWTALPTLNSQFGSAFVYDIAVDPASSLIVYAGTDRGVFKSVDGGGAWQIQINGFPNNSPSRARRLAISQSNPAVLYAALDSSSVLLKTTNGASAWSRVTTPFSVFNLNSMTIDPANPDVVYAAVNFSGLYKSTDGGVTWRTINDGLNINSVRAVAIPRQTPMTVYAAASFPTEAFVTKFNASGSAPVYSSYIGGDSNDTGLTVAVDAAGAAIIAGSSQSANFPTASAYQAGLKGSDDAFVSKIKPDGSETVWSTYLGGDGLEYIRGVAANAAGEVFVTGGTTSTNFPTVRPIQPTINQTTNLSLTDPAAGDLNGDGLTDVAVIYSSDRVAVMFGAGRGELGRPATYFVGQSPQGLKLADFNRDGKLDFLVTNAGSSSVTIQLNNGRGEFNVGIPILTGANSRALGVADFNNDGNLDLMVKSVTSGLALLAGNGRGDFNQIASGLAASFQNPIVTTGDFNGDGNTDAAVIGPDAFSNCSFGNGNFIVLSGDGRGGFTPGAARTLAERPTAFKAADVNNDGRDDLLFASTCSASGLFVMLANDAGFANPVRYDIGREAVGPQSLVIGEFNGDGKLDAAVSTSMSGNVSVMLGKGDGSFASSIILPVSAKANLMAAGDFNEDGVNDLVVTRNGGSGVSILLNRAFCVPASGAVVTSAASFAGRKPASESIAALFGANLAQSSETAQSTPLPTTLAGVSVKIKDSAGVERLAPLFSVSPRQINLLIPAGVAPGVALVNVMNGASVVASTTIEIVSTSPGLFSADMTGTGLASAVALRVKAGGSRSFEPIARFDAAQNKFVAVPIDLGEATDQVFLILFGSGLRNSGALTSVSAKVGGENVEVSYAGTQGGFAGLDQVNLKLSQSLRGRGEVDVVLMVNGGTANTVRVFTQ